MNLRQTGFEIECGELDEMIRYAFAFMVALAVVPMLACEYQDAKRDGDSKGVGGTDCYEACLNKGATAELCESYCGGSKGGAGVGGKKPGDGQGAGSNGIDNLGSGGAGGQGDVLEQEKAEQVRAKDCVQCWYDETRTQGACAAEAEHCRDSLACTQLQWCPLICEQENCVEGCNEIIPTGVAPLTAVVRCAACGDGPCADACRDSYLMTYCE